MPGQRRVLDGDAAGPVAPSARPSATRACVNPAVITTCSASAMTPQGPPEVRRGAVRSAGLPPGIAVAEGVGAGVRERPPHGGHPPGPGEQREIGVAAGEVSKPRRGRLRSSGARRAAGGTSATPRRCALAGSRRAPRRPTARRRRRRVPLARPRSPAGTTASTAVRGPGGQAAVDDGTAQRLLDGGLATDRPAAGSAAASTGPL